eukprot:226580-Rhodomonas_salina.1
MAACPKEYRHVTYHITSYDIVQLRGLSQYRASHSTAVDGTSQLVIGILDAKRRGFPRCGFSLGFLLRHGQKRLGVRLDLYPNARRQYQYRTARST